MIARAAPILTAALVAALAGGTASASCASGATCSCNAVLTGVAFGSYDTQRSSPTDSVGTLSISCQSSNFPGSSLSIAMGPGASGNVAARAMTTGSHALSYNLYVDAARTMVWGDDSGGGQAVASSFPTGARETRTFSIYGRIPPMQNAWVGSYRDTVTVTIAY